MALAREAFIYRPIELPTMKVFTDILAALDWTGYAQRVAGPDCCAAAFSERHPRFKKRNALHNSVQPYYDVDSERWFVLFMHCEWGERGQAKCVDVHFLPTVRQSQPYFFECPEQALALKAFASRFYGIPCRQVRVQSDVHHKPGYPFAPQTKLSGIHAIELIYCLLRMGARFIAFLRMSSKFCYSGFDFSLDWLQYRQSTLFDLLLLVKEGSWDLVPNFVGSLVRSQ